MKTPEEMIAEQYYHRPANDSWVHKSSHSEISSEQMEWNIKEAMKHC